MTDTAEITDADIREWARQTGRQVGVKGRVGAELRREYERLVTEANATPPATATDEPAGPGEDLGARGSQIDSAGPGPAAPETRPRRPRPRASSLRGRAQRMFTGNAPKRKSGPRRSGAGRARVSCERLIGGAWEGCSRLLQPVNLPLSRCLSWQSDTAGPVLDEAIKGTFIDAIAQPLARTQETLTTIGSFVGPPAFVLALQLPANQPMRQGMVQLPDGSTGPGLVPWPAGAMRQQMLMTGLAETLAACAQKQEQLPEEVRQRQADRERRRAEMRIVIEAFFAPPQSAGPAGAAAEEEAMRAAREYLRGD